MFVCSGIFFAHESPRLGETFVTRKISRSAARIKAGQHDKLFSGNLEARCDWGYAPEYCGAMWLILQQNSPADYVIGTGSSHSVRDVVEEMFNYAGLNWVDYVESDPLYRPSEVDHLCADTSKADQELRWRPTVGSKQLVKIMMDAQFSAIGHPCGGPESPACVDAS